LRGLKYTEVHPDKELEDKYKYFARYDRKKWRCGKFIFVWYLLLQQDVY